MRCEDVQSLFSEYYDKTTNLFDEISLHLEKCIVCKTEYSEFKSLLEYLPEIKEPAVPDKIRRALVSHVDGFVKGNKNRISIYRHRFWTGLSSAAAAAAAVLLVWFTGIFDTGALHENFGMHAEYIVPSAAHGWAAPSPFEIEGHLPGRMMNVPEAAGGIADNEYFYNDEWPESSFNLVPDDDRLIGFRAAHEDVIFASDMHETENRVQTGFRPHLLTAILFAIIGMAAGYKLNRLVEYIDRKSKNAL